MQPLFHSNLGMCVCVSVYVCISVCVLKCCNVPVSESSEDISTWNLDDRIQVPYPRIHGSVCDLYVTCGSAPLALWSVQSEVLFKLVHWQVCFWVDDFEGAVVFYVFSPMGWTTSWGNLDWGNVQRKRLNLWCHVSELILDPLKLLCTRKKPRKFSPTGSPSILSSLVLHLSSLNPS